MEEKQMTSSDYKILAKEKLSGIWAPAIAALVIVTIISAVLGFTVIGAIVLAGPLTLGYSYFLLRVSGKKEAELGELTKGIGNFTRAFAVRFIRDIIQFLWGLLFIVPGIVKAYSYSMAMYILADHPEYSWKQCLSESKRIMDGNKSRLMYLHFSFIGWIILSLCTYGILFIWVIPYIMQAQTEFYLSVRDDVVLEPEVKKAEESNTENADASEKSENSSELLIYKIISFLIPIVGLILYIIYKKDNIRKAEACGKWALIGVAAFFGVILLLAFAIFIIWALSELYWYI